MKRLLRTGPVQAILARMIAAYVELVTATMRWRFENLAAADAMIAADEGGIVLFWHGRIAHAMACRSLLKTKPRRAMISLSRDGAFIAKAAERLGIPTVRGSTGRSDETLAKGGVGAYREALKTILDGGAILITPDGPRGPREVMAVGPVRLARAAQCPVFILGLAARPALALGGWDQGRIPLPFARGCLVLDGPLHAPGGQGGDTDKAVGADWQARLCAAQSRAESVLRDWIA